MTTTTKLLSALLAIMLALTLLPGPALAADANVSNAGELTTALGQVVSGDTIKLTANINYNAAIKIDGIVVTFDLNGKTLNVTADSGAGLFVDNNGEVKLTGSGAFNVKSIDMDGSEPENGCGVYADNGGKATVTNAEGTLFGVYADNGAKVTVEGMITIPGGGNAVYIQVGSAEKAENLSEPTSGKPFYLEYNNQADVVHPTPITYVWVRDHDNPKAVGSVNLRKPTDLVFQFTDIPAAGAFSFDSVQFMNVTTNSNYGQSLYNSDGVVFDRDAKTLTIPAAAFRQHNNEPGNTALTKGLYRAKITFMIELASHICYADFTLTSSSSGGGGGGGIATTLTVEGQDENGKIIHSKTESAVSGQTLTVNAPQISGYTLDDDAKKTITIKSGINKLTFLYTAYSAPPPWNNPFGDVRPSDWFYADVEYVHTHGLMSGTGGGSFSPYSPLTRAMLVTILYRQEGSPDVSGLDNPFSDVAAGKWYTGAVKWAAANGIINGYDGKFYPENYIMRQDLAVILWRYAKYAGFDVSVGENTNILSYNDAFGIAEYAIEAIQWAVGAGIISGKPQGSLFSAEGGIHLEPGNLLDPRGTATRAEAAAMLHRLLTTATASN